MITATEFCNKPNVAIKLDKIICIQYNFPASSSFFTVKAISCFFSGDFGATEEIFSGFAALGFAVWCLSPLLLVGNRGKSLRLYALLGL